MRERGILFSGAMVRALLAGKKTQTRRAVKPQPDQWMDVDDVIGPVVLYWGDKPFIEDPDRSKSCPYGRVGDRLWVRESFALKADGTVLFMADSSHGRAQSVVWRLSIFMPRSVCRLTLAVESIRVERAQAISDADIEAEGVDAEAVQSLWDDPKNRRRWGQVQLSGRFPGFDGRTPRELWSTAWTLINGRASWDANPWVWAVSFRRLP